MGAGMKANGISHEEFANRAVKIVGIGLIDKLVFFVLVLFYFSRFWFRLVECSRTSCFSLH